MSVSRPDHVRPLRSPLAPRSAVQPRAGRAAPPRVGSRSSSPESVLTRSAICILWHSPARRVSPDLLRALDRRDLEVVVRPNPERAFAEILTAAASRRAVPLVLLMYEPSSLPGVGAMAEALRRYAPHALCWGYAKDAAPSLYAVELDQVQSPPPEPIRRRRTREIPLPKAARPGREADTPLLFDPAPVASGAGDATGDLRGDLRGSRDARGIDARGSEIRGSDIRGSRASGMATNSPGSQEARESLPALSQRLAVSDEEIAMLLAHDDEKPRMD